MFRDGTFFGIYFFLSSQPNAFSCHLLFLTCALRRLLSSPLLICLSTRLSVWLARRVLIGLTWTNRNHSLTGISVTSASSLIMVVWGAARFSVFTVTLNFSILFLNIFFLSVEVLCSWTNYQIRGWLNYEVPFPTEASMFFMEPMNRVKLSCLK